MGMFPRVGQCPDAAPYVIFGPCGGQPMKRSTATPLHEEKQPGPAESGQRLRAAPGLKSSPPTWKHSNSSTTQQGASCWQPHRRERRVGLRVFTYFTLLSWGLCNRASAGLFIGETQGNEPRTAAQEIRPKAWNVQGGKGRMLGKRTENQVSVWTQCWSLKKCYLLLEGRLMYRHTQTLRVGYCFYNSIA